MSDLPPFTYIDDTETLRWLAVELANEPLLAFDTEANSMHAYRERVCLVQISTREDDYIVDPFPIEDMSPLGVLLANPNIEILFHAAEYDLINLDRDYGFKLKNLFDTMIAARVAGYEHIGLANMLKHYFGIEPDKSHQQADWGARPIPLAQLKYAQMDTHFLPELRDRLRADLIDMDRWEEAQELFRDGEAVTDVDRSFDPDGFWRIGRPNQVRGREMAVLRELYLVREALAQEADVPPHKILNNRVLVTLSKAQPRTQRDLSKIRGVSRGRLNQYGVQIIEAVKRGKVADLPEPPPLPTPPSPEVTERFSALQQWRKNRGIERGVHSDVVMPKGVLWQLAKDYPRTLADLEGIPGLGPWRRATYGQEMLDVLNEVS